MLTYQIRDDYKVRGSLHRSANPTIKIFILRELGLHINTSGFHHLNHLSATSRSIAATMKFAVLFLLALLGAANANLNDDFQELIALIPVAEIKALTVEYAKNDAEFQIAVAYVRSDDFKAILRTVGETPQWQEFVAYLDKSEVNIYKFIEGIWRLLEAPGTFNVHRSPRTYQRSFHGWLDAVMAMIPVDDLVALTKNLARTSPDFQEFIERIKGEEFQVVVRAVNSSPEWQALLAKGREHGVPVDRWIDLMYNLFRWTRE